MPLLKKSETRLDRSSDPLWWALAAVLSLASVWLPTLLPMQSDRMTPWLVAYLAMFFSGGLLGGLRPDRVWRWGIAAFLAFAARDFAHAASNPNFTWFTGEELWAFIAANISGWAAGTIPMFIGAYLGFYLARGNIR
jgi:hypothetical protein